jgi:uncharacterized delta-60 repeat protein
MNFRSISSLIVVATIWMGIPSRILATGSHFDLSFSNNGYSSIDFGADDLVTDSAIQSDGKIVVVGATGPAHQFIALARFNANGSLDTTFDGDGRVIFDTRAMTGSAVAIQSNGKIVVAGSIHDDTVGQLDFAVARFNTNGSIDTAFGTNGIVMTDAGNNAGASSSAGGVAIQSDQKIIAVGYAHRPGVNSDFGVVRYTTTGALDSTFGTGGIVNTDMGTQDSDQAYAVAIAPSGKFAVAGTTFSSNQNGAVARYNFSGSLDTSFGGGDGLVTTDFAGHSDGFLDVDIRSDGSIIAAGSATLTTKETFALARYLPDGTLDPSFGGTGKVTTDTTLFLENVAFSVVRQADGKIVAAGQERAPDGIGGNIVLTRYNPNGTLDSAFGHAGIIRSDLNNGSDDQAWSVGIQPDGKLVVAGRTRAAASGSPSNFVVARYWPNLNTRFDYDGDSFADLSVVRSATGNTWYFQGSTAGFTSTTFGLPNDKLVPADYDGDAIADVGVYRPSNGTWYWIKSASNTFTFTQFGVAEDLPTPADYDGDGRADISVFRPSVGVWYRLNSATGAFVFTQFGLNGDKPTIGDFDGDGRADLAVFRPSTSSWYQLSSYDGSFAQTQFGLSTDIPAPGDFDGDGKTDICIFRPTASGWYRLNISTGAFVAVNFGTVGDLPVVSDYDRDGRDDISLFRSSTGAWYRLNSSNGNFVAQQFGTNGDHPTPAAFEY